jgi:hypothetical protein
MCSRRRGSTRARSPAPTGSSSSNSPTPSPVSIQVFGLFQSKAFATSISPWIVTAEALAPFRISAGPEMPPPPYLVERGADLAHAVEPRVGIAVPQLWAGQPTLRARQPVPLDVAVRRDSAIGNPTRVLGVAAALEGRIRDPIAGGASARLCTLQNQEFSTNSPEYRLF